MKKLLILVLVLLLSACTPDENTADDMQAWYDACEEIPSCVAKIDELREKELAESDIILAIQDELILQTDLLNAHGLVIEDHEARIQALEEEQARLQAELDALNERVTMLESMFSAGAFKDYLEQHDIAHVVRLEQLPDNVYNIRINIEQLRDSAGAMGYNMVNVRDRMLALITDQLGHLLDTDKVTITLEYVDGDVVYTLTQLLAIQTE